VLKVFQNFLGGKFEIHYKPDKVAEITCVVLESHLTVRNHHGICNLILHHHRSSDLRYRLRIFHGRDVTQTRSPYKGLGF
jgi:hypothetical protein